LHARFGESPREAQRRLLGPFWDLQERRGRRGQGDIVFVMVPDAPDVEAVLFGKGGVAEGIAKGKVVADMSPISPVATEQFAKRMNALGTDYLDAPVSGGEVGAVEDQLNIAPIWQNNAPVFPKTRRDSNSARQ
jgi:6-phosphogluconate dehydrogenase (decarboxylating)